MGLPTPALMLVLATVLPLVAFLALLGVGKRVGSPLAGGFTTITLALSFGCTMIAMVAWFAADPGHYQGSEWGKGIGPIFIPIQWLPIGTLHQPMGVAQDHPGALDLGIYLDSLTIVLFAMVTLVGVAVSVCSVAFMRRDPRNSAYFAFVSLLCFAMLGLLIGGTLIHLLIFWQLLSLCVYLLIGFWNERPAANRAAFQSFMVQMVGDVGFVLGIGILVYHLGNVSFPQLWTYLAGAGSGHGVPLPGGGRFHARMLTLMGESLFCSAAARSALFPFQVWLADSVEAPAPINALLQSATATASGVYLMARCFPILTPNARLLIAIIAVVTMPVGALAALAQTNLRRLLAFSTMSQMGLIMLALSVGSWIGALFHLVTYAFAKSLLSISAASVSGATHDDDINHYGGLLRRLPLAGVLFALGGCSLAGLPFLAVADSQRMILQHTAALASLARMNGQPAAWWLFFWAPAGAGYLTAFYVARAWWMTFAGKPRDPKVYRRARDFPVMAVPMLGLAFLCVVAGRNLSLPQMLNSSIRETNGACRDVRQRDDFFKGRDDRSEFTRSWPAEMPDEPLAVGTMADAALQQGRIAANGWPRWGPWAGVLAAALVYGLGTTPRVRLLSLTPIHWVRQWLQHGMYLPDLYRVIPDGLIAVAAAVVGWIDQRVVGSIMNAIVLPFRRLGRRGIRFEERRSRAA